MKCTSIGDIEVEGVKYRNYICNGTTSFFLRLTLIVQHAESVRYWYGMLIVDFHSILPYLYTEEHLTFKKLRELLKKAKTEGTEVVRYMFSFGPTVHVLTPEPEVFRQIFRVVETAVLSWITLGRQAIQYLDGIVAMFGIHKTPQTLMYFVECVTKKYLEEAQRK
jgi:hypothetical protein